MVDFARSYRTRPSILLALAMHHMGLDMHLDDRYSLFTICFMHDHGMSNKMYQFLLLCIELLESLRF